MEPTDPSGEESTLPQVPPHVIDMMDPRRAAVKRYWNRALFTFQNAMSPEADPEFRAMVLAFCTHSTQSLVEALERIVEEDPDHKPLWSENLSKLPYTTLISFVRNHDLHGNPIPVCDPKRVGMMMQSGKKPMQATCSHGVAINVQWPTGAPKVHLTPKDQKHGKFTPGDAITYVCEGDILGITDPATGKTLKLLKVLDKQLRSLEPIVRQLLGFTPEGEAEAE